MTSIWQRGDRFVREQDRCLDGQHPRQRDPAAFAAGQFGYGAFGEPDNVGGLHRAQHGLLVTLRQPCRIGGAMRVTPERDDVLGRQRPMHVMTLRQITEAPGTLAQ
jgi:hypothetical protein